MICAEVANPIPVDELRLPASWLQLMTPMLDAESRNQRLREIGVPPDRADQADYLLSGQQLLALLQLLLRHTPAGQSPALWVLQDFSISVNNVVGMAAIAAPTVGAAIELVVEHYPRVMISPVAIHCERSPIGDLLLTFEPVADLGDATQLMLEIIMGAHALPSGSSRGRFRAERLSFRAVAPSYAKEYQQTFRCPVQFGAADNLVVISAAAAALPQRSANPATCEAMLQLLRRDWPVMHPSNVISHRLRRAIQSSFDSTARWPDLQAAADSLYVSTRTLRRQLATEGSHFRQIRDELRMQHAEKLLRHSKETVNRIAQQSGYRSESAFCRAWRLRYGEPPERWRSARQ